jgi:hypothetical protein
VGIRRRQRKSAQGNTVIDLTAFERNAQSVRWGLPSPCPECSKPGYLDHIDPFREVMFQHCPSCWHKWETARADISTTVSA